MPTLNSLSLELRRRIWYVFYYSDEPVRLGTLLMVRLRCTSEALPAFLLPLIYGPTTAPSKRRHPTTQTSSESK